MTNQQEPEEDTLASSVYCGTRVLETVLVSLQDGEYIVRNLESKFIAAAPTQTEALDKADLYLSGYLRGSRDSREIIDVTVVRSGAIAETEQRPRATVEIETMAKGPAKVTVRVDGDDPAAAALECLRVWQLTTKALVEFDEA